MHQFQQTAEVVRLIGILQGHFISGPVSAFLTLMDNHVPFFAVGFNRNRFQNPFAFGSPVTGIHIQMQRVKAFGTVVPASP
ncbi:hypothetical protein EFBL_3562 [Effusibacillus lacus]|uniref:Uncharacterized protein n=1 Tax=Effusibacillus lacus TaxID=1348429 RepID=A0A292YSH8_9BACL|nr:hypothetical protein EFBL_3562 [Effusibacillus lacus]